MANAAWVRVFLALCLLLLARGPRQCDAVPDTCSPQLSHLVACAPFLVPDAPQVPSPQCCSALGSITHDCACSTLSIINSLPARCNLSPVSCPASTA